MLVLYEHSENEKWEDMKFKAILQGIDLEKARQRRSQKRSSNNSDDDLVFGDPKDYRKMTKEQRDELSKRMMKKFKSFANHSALEVATKCRSRVET